MTTFFENLYHPGPVMLHAFLDLPINPQTAHTSHWFAPREPLQQKYLVSAVIARGRSTSLFAVLGGPADPRQPRTSSQDTQHDHAGLTTDTRIRRCPRVEEIPAISGTGTGTGTWLCDAIAPNIDQIAELTVVS